MVGTDGIGFFGVMFLLFLGLKLGKVISWSWWFVTMPLYTPIIILLMIATVIWIVSLVIE